MRLLLTCLSRKLQSFRDTLVEMTLRAQIGEYNLCICRLYGCNECRITEWEREKEPDRVVYIGWRADTVFNGYYWFHLECFSQFNGRNYFKMGSQIQGLTKYFEASDVYGINQLSNMQQLKVKDALQSFYSRISKLRLPKRISLMNRTELKTECQKRCLSTKNDSLGLQHRIAKFMQHKFFVKQEQKKNDLLVFGYIKWLLSMPKYSHLVFPIYLMAMVVEYCPIHMLLQ